MSGIIDRMVLDAASAIESTGRKFVTSRSITDKLLDDDFTRIPTFKTIGWILTRNGYTSKDTWNNHSHISVYQRVKE